MQSADIISRTVLFFAIRRRRDYIIKPGLIILPIHLLNILFEYLILGPDLMVPIRERVLLTNLVALPFITLAFMMLIHLDQLQMKLAHLASTDGLTDLPNRRAFIDETRNSATGYMLIIDVDYFKTINDTHGHAAGDYCLQSIAYHLRNTIRSGDVLGRIGGEEFAIFIPQITVAELGSLGARLTAPLYIALPDGVTEVCITLSAGAARKRLHDRVKDVFRRADSALYAAKTQGRARLVVWEKTLENSPLSPTLINPSQAQEAFLLQGGPRH